MTDNTTDTLDFFTADELQAIDNFGLPRALPDNPKWFWDDFISMRDVTLLRGDVGRRYLAIQLAASAACSVPVLASKVASGPAIYCDEQNFIDTMPDWVAKFAEANNLGHHGFKRLHICSLSSGHKTLATMDDQSGNWGPSDAWRSLTEKVEEERPTLFVLDANFDPEKDTEYAAQIVDQMRSMAAEFNLAALLVAPMSATGEDKVWPWESLIDTHLTIRSKPSGTSNFPTYELLVKYPMVTMMQLALEGPVLVHDRDDEVPF